MENREHDIEKKHIKYALYIPCGIVLALLLCFLVENGMDWDFTHGGIFPRQAKGLGGILTHGFIHADWSHLFNNCLSLFVLSSFLCYFYTPLDKKILLFSYLGSGILLWIIGRPCWHVGASGLVYSLCFFLFFSGIFRKHIPLVAVSLIVVFLYGNVVWHMFPWQTSDPVSWEGHLSGGVTGTIIAICYRHKGPQKPAPEWEDEEDKDEIETTEGNDNNKLIENRQIDNNDITA